MGNRDTVGGCSNFGFLTVARPNGHASDLFR